MALKKTNVSLNDTLLSIRKDIWAIREQTEVQLKDLGTRWPSEEKEKAKKESKNVAKKKVKRGK